jgi:adenylate cyclase
MHTSTSAVDGFESAMATVAFVDLAGFSAIADVYGDASAIAVLGRFEELVRHALGGLGAPIKWIGDEAMFGFPDPATALQVLGRLLPACRAEPQIPLTRTGLNHGPVLRRADDLFGSTVNVAARVAALASPGQLLATKPVADIAAASGIVVRDMGKTALRSIADHVPLYSIELAPALDPAWIDPVCKMHAPYEAYRRTAPTGPWFCSKRCAEAYRRSPDAYRGGSNASIRTARPPAPARTRRLR